MKTKNKNKVEKVHKVTKNLPLKDIRNGYLDNIKEEISYQDGPEEKEHNQASINNNSVNNIKHALKNLSFDPSDTDAVSKIADVRKSINKLYKKTSANLKIADEKIQAKRDKLLIDYVNDFDKKFVPGNYNFSEHFNIINEKNINSLSKAKNYSDVADYLIDSYVEDVFGSLPLSEGVFVTDHKLPCNAKAKYEIFASMCSLNYDDTPSLSEFFIGKRVRLKNIEQEYPDEEMQVFISDAIHIVHKEKFIALDLSKYSDADKKAISEALLKVYKMYNTLATLSKDGCDDDDFDDYYQAMKNISDYKGIGPEHEVFFDHSIIS